MNKTMKTMALALSLALFAGNTLAGTSTSVGKHVIVDPPQPKEVFTASIYDAVKINDNNSKTFEGAGASIGYDLWDDVKISLSTTYFWESNGTFDFALSLDKSYNVWRKLNFYTTVGGGFEQADENQWFLFSGGGLSWNFNDSFAVYTDANYTFGEDADFKVLRLGVNYKF